MVSLDFSSGLFTLPAHQTLVSYTQRSSISDKMAGLNLDLYFLEILIKNQVTHSQKSNSQEPDDEPVLFKNKKNPGVKNTSA